MTIQKESYYFSHDYDAQNDPKLQALISEYKAEGYGVYWAIIEMLHKETYHELPLKKYVFLAIAKQMLTSAEQVEAIINFAINDCELFVENDGVFYSERVLRNFEKRAEISQKRSEAGKLGAIAKQNLANASKGKESKSKESKVNLEEKQNDFLSQLKDFNSQYPKDMINGFYLYWTEPNKSKTKLRYEMEKTWDIARRLATWERNSSKFGEKNKSVLTGYNDV